MQGLQSLTKGGGGSMRYHIISARTVGFFVLALLLTTPLIWADPPVALERVAPADLQAQSRRCREILKTSIIDFYLPACVDRKDGGYFEALKGNRFAATGEKFLTLQSRQLWFFS